MKVYIAGKITGNKNYVEQFEKAEKVLKELGHAVINPVKNIGFSDREYIDMGLSELSKCDAICLLEGYEESNGALLEIHYAMTVGMTVMHLRGIGLGIKSS